MVVPKKKKNVMLHAQSHTVFPRSAQPGAGTADGFLKDRDRKRETGRDERQPAELAGRREEAGEARRVGEWTGLQRHTGRLAPTRQDRAAAAW